MSAHPYLAAKKPFNITDSYLAKLFFIAFLGISCPATASSISSSELNTNIRNLQTEWENVFYGLPTEQHAERFKSLLDRLDAIEAQYPEAAPPKVLKAMVLCTYAGTERGLGALNTIEKARDLLRNAIQIDPRALEGSAWITLGNLYQRLPGWPISFGDNTLAREYLDNALKMFPSAMDTNYFYGNFLLEQGEYDEALTYLEKANSIPLTEKAGIADQQLKHQIEQALLAAHEHRASSDDLFSKILAEWIIPTEGK